MLWEKVYGSGDWNGYRSPVCSRVEPSTLRFLARLKNESKELPIRKYMTFVPGTGLVEVDGILKNVGSESVLVVDGVHKFCVGPILDSTRYDQVSNFMGYPPELDQIRGSGIVLMREFWGSPNLYLDGLHWDLYWNDITKLSDKKTRLRLVWLFGRKPKNWARRSLEMLL